MAVRAKAKIGVVGALRACESSLTAAWCRARSGSRVDGLFSRARMVGAEKEGAMEGLPARANRRIQTSGCGLRA